MKRITTLVLAVAMAIGAASAALADGIDVKVKGAWDFTFGWVVGDGFSDNVHGSRSDRNDDHFKARHRVRTQVNFIASEYLQGVVMLEIGNLTWGRGGGRLDADQVVVELKRAYLDWIIPNTEISVRMGVQGLTLPSTPMGSPLFDADVAGIVVSSPITDWLSATAFWIRPFDAYGNDYDDPPAGWKDTSYSDEVDVFGLLLPMQGDGWAVTPWGMYGFIGANSGIYDYLYRSGFNNTVNAANSHAKAWWLGTHFELTMFDPFVFNFEAIYGRLQRANLTGFNTRDGGRIIATDPDIGTSGWYIGATLDYKLDWGTPGIFGWWASGDKSSALDSGKYGRMPVLGNDGGSFGPTSFGGVAGVGIADDGAIMGTGTGTWGIGIQLADVSFIEDLSHTLRVAYYRGTNSKYLARRIGDTMRYSADAFYLTTEDSVWEVNFDHRYKIYENLTAILELGYLNLNADEDTWGNRNNDESSGAFKAELNFQFTF